MHLAYLEFRSVVFYDSIPISILPLLTRISMANWNDGVLPRVYNCIENVLFTCRLVDLGDLATLAWL